MCGCDEIAAALEEELIQQCATRPLDKDLNLTLWRLRSRIASSPNTGVLKVPACGRASTLREMAERRDSQSRRFCVIDCYMAKAKVELHLARVPPADDPEARVQMVIDMGNQMFGTRPTD